MPSIAALCLTSLSSAVARTAAIGEVIIHGLGVILFAPFSQDLHLKEGIKIISEAPGNVLRAVFLPFEFLIDFYMIINEPKGFIYSKSECMKVNSNHANARSIGSDKHLDDLVGAAIDAKGKLMAYQKALRKKALG